MFHRYIYIYPRHEVTMTVGKGECSHQKNRLVNAVTKIYAMWLCAYLDIAVPNWKCSE